MNPAEILNLTVPVIKDRPASSNDKWILLVVDNKIMCIANNGERYNGFPLMLINRTQAEKGFTGREYDQIIHRIKDYQKHHPEFYAEVPGSSIWQCEACGCTDTNCQPCIDATGKACEWIEKNKCSRCFTKKGNLKKKPTNETKPNPNAD